MSEWIEIDYDSDERKYPQHSQKCKIKIYDRETNKEFVLDATYIDHELFRYWDFKSPVGTYITHLPSAWMIPDNPPFTDTKS